MISFLKNLIGSGKKLRSVDRAPGIVVDKCRKMRPAQGVSFPRSGHEIIFHLAKRYFGDEFFYCDAGAEEYCGCRTTPCVNPKRTFAKNHDFSISWSDGVAIIPSERYFIQYRNPVRSIVSNFYLFRRNFPDKDTYEHWKQFAHKQINFWNKFIDKWVSNFPLAGDARMYCVYEDLVANPDYWVRKSLEFLSYGPVDDDAVARILDELPPIIPRDNLANFDYFDPVFFSELEHATSNRLFELKLPSFGEGV